VSCEFVRSIIILLIDGSSRNNYHPSSESLFFCTFLEDNRPWHAGAAHQIFAKQISTLLAGTPWF
jgi:hypothetical protein